MRQARRSVHRGHRGAERQYRRSPVEGELTLVGSEQRRERSEHGRTVEHGLRRPGACDRPHQPGVLRGDRAARQGRRAGDRGSSPSAESSIGCAGSSASPSSCADLIRARLGSYIGFEREVRRGSAARPCWPPTTPLNKEPVGDDVVAFDHGEPDRGAQRVAERAGPDVADPVAVAQERFAAKEQGLGVVEQDVDHPRGAVARVASLPSASLPTKPPGLSHGDREGQSGDERVVGVLDVDAVVAVALLQPQRAHREQADLPEAVRRRRPRRGSPTPTRPGRRGRAARSRARRGR